MRGNTLRINFFTVRRLGWCGNCCICGLSAATVKLSTGVGHGVAVGCADMEVIKSSTDGVPVNNLKAVRAPIQVLQLTSHTPAEQAESVIPSCVIRFLCLSGWSPVSRVRTVVRRTASKALSCLLNTTRNNAQCMLREGRPRSAWRLSAVSDTHTRKM